MTDDAQFEWTDEPPDDALDPRRLLVVFALALTLYVASSSSVVFWGDSAEFALRAATLELSPHARGYPLHRALTWAAGKVLGDPAFGANLVSVLFGALSVTLVYECGRMLGRSAAAGWTAAGALALAHTFWDFSGVAEVYTLHTALLLLAVLCAIHAGRGSPRAALGMGLVLGIATLHHRLIYFAIPALVFWLWFASDRKERGRHLRQCALGFAVGVVPFVLLCALCARPVPEGVDNPVWWWVQDVFLGGALNADAFLGSGRRSIFSSAVYLLQFVALNLPGPALLLALAGLVAAPRLCGRRVAWPLWALVASLLWFPLKFDSTGDQYAFLVALYPILAIAAAIGTSRLGELRGPRVAAAAAVVVILMPPVLYSTLAFSDLGRDALPRVRADWARSYFLPVRSGDRTPLIFGTRVLDRLADGDLLHADWGDGMVFRYLQEVEGKAPGVRIRLWYHGRLVVGDEVTGAEYVSVFPRNAQLPAAVERVRSRLEPVPGMADERLFRVLREDR